VFCLIKYTLQEIVLGANASAGPQSNGAFDLGYYWKT